MFAITHRKLFLYIALALVLGSISILALFQLRLGIDFTGGSLTEVVYSERPAQSEVEAVLRPLEFGEFSVRASLDEAGRDAFLIRTRDLSEDERATVATRLTEIGSAAEITRFTSIGPVIGAELRSKAGWAILAVISIIVLYVAFAFAGIGTPVSSWTYGGITILVLVHDVLIPTAVMSLLGVFMGAEVDVLFVMALLAVLGYSVNDTIVVFDRVREKLVANRTEERSKREEAGVYHEEVTYTLTRPYDELVGEAVGETIARSVNTSLTTALAVGALYVLGGTVTQTFSLILLAGILAGTYSSIFIASPLVVAYAKWKKLA